MKAIHALALLISLATSFTAFADGGSSTCASNTSAQLIAVTNPKLVDQITGITDNSTPVDTVSPATTTR